MLHMVKVALPADIDAVALLAREIWVDYFVPIIGQEQVDYMLGKFQSAPAIARQISDGYHYYMVMKGEQRSGYFAFVPHPAERTAQLSKIYVRRADRGHGIGKAILSFVEDRCAGMAIRELWLTVNRHNADSIAFYRKMGFAKSDRLVQDIGNGFVMDDFRMTKRIRSRARGAGRPSFTTRTTIMKKTPLRFLVIGCGSIGKRHLRLLHERADLAVAACDSDPAALDGVRAIGSDILFFTDLPSALKEWKPAFVVVANPNRFHAASAIAALRAGAHVLCEKPIADTVANGRRIVAEARTHNRTLLVGYTERYRDSLQHIEKMAAAGELGTLTGGRALVGTYNTLLCSRTACRTAYGTILVDYTHEFDFLRGIFGDVREVACFANELGNKKLKASPATAVTVLRYKSGALVTVHMDYIQHPQRRTLEVFGDRKSVELDLQNDVLRIFDTDTPGVHTLTFENVRDNRFRLEHQDLIDSALKGTPPRVDGSAGLRALEIAEKAIRQITRAAKN